MSLASYTDLKTALTSWFHDRTDVAGIADDLIDLAEARFNRELRSRQMDQVSASLTITAGVATAPSDMVQLLSLRLVAEPYTVIDYQPVDVIEAQNPASTEAPRFYTLVGSSIITWPATTATARLRYRARITPLSSADPTNWILQSHPDLYLKASLLGASEYFVDDARIPLWESQVATAIERINRESIGQVAGTIRPMPTVFGA